MSPYYNYQWLRFCGRTKNTHRPSPCFNFPSFFPLSDHKTGRECWLDPYGNPSTIWASRVLSRDWEKLLTWIKKPFYPAKNESQSLCSYLQNTNVEHGMRIYIDVAFGRWYHDVVTNWDYVHNTNQHDNNRTLFLCYEHLADPNTRVQTMHQLLDWLFPGGVGGGDNNNNKWVFDEPEHDKYSGKHSTSHDMIRRTKLKAVIELVDRKDFGGRIAALNEQFRCGVANPITTTALSQT